MRQMTLVPPKPFSPVVPYQVPNKPPMPPMEVPSHYWRLVRIDATSQLNSVALPSAKAFLKREVVDVQAGSNSGSDVVGQPMADGLLQAHLAQLIPRSKDSSAPSISLAEGCLRCYISHQVEAACRQLEARFGYEHGFSRHDLFPYVLDESYPLYPVHDKADAGYQSLTADILASFDPSRASLSTWVTRRVRHHRDLNRFLLEHGVYLVSDWAILNDTTPKQLRRIFAEFHRLSPSEIQLAADLLHSYHAVYRRDRILQRQSGGASSCLPPTPDQLQRMVQQLPAHHPLRQHAHEVLGQLQAMATYLRQYRIHMRGGMAAMESLDRPEVGATVTALPTSSLEADADEGVSEFLQFYRQQLQQCLDQAISEVIDQRVQRLQRRKNNTAPQFLKALYLFHCRGQAMGAIATAVGLDQQYQVSRLLKLKELRADIRRHLLQLLCDRIRAKAKLYASPERLNQLDHHLETVLDEQIGQLIDAAEAEASTAQTQTPTSLLTQRLCRHLENRGDIQ